MKQARTQIGVDLHRQIRDALSSDEAGAARRLSSAFTVGYIHTFVRDGFRALGVDAEATLDYQVKHICDGVLPGKLFQIYQDQGAAVMAARSMKGQDAKILGAGLSPAEVSKVFLLGGRAGTFDAPLVSLQATPPDNLRRYLLDQPVKV